MCFYDDGEYPDLCDSSVVKSRKHRTCGGCNGQIARGDLYMRIKYLYEGSWDRVDYCGSCYHTRQLLHEEEIRKGCSQIESWCPYEDIDIAVNSGEYETKRSSRDEGQVYMSSLYAKRVAVNQKGIQ